jgi:hypothetical protein
VAYVGVIGPGDASVAQVRLAEEVGRLLGEAGHVVLTGGLGGVMGAASKGARLAGATVVGLLPGADRSAGNAYLTVVLPTGMGELRNGLLVRACDALICIPGSWGTLSEVSLAMRTGVPVVMLGQWAGVVPTVVVDDPAEAVSAVARFGP